MQVHFLGQEDPWVENTLNIENTSVFLPENQDVGKAVLFLLAAGKRYFP